MNFLVIVTFISCYLTEYFARKLNLISPYFVLVPELLSGVVLLLVIGRLMLGARIQLDFRYLLFIGVLALTVAMGAVAQNVPTGAIVSGLRSYVPFVPFLLLGAVYPFTSRQIRAQLAVLALLLVVQVPLAVYQRFFAFADRMHTGDVVTGTVRTSSALSILMVSSIAVLTALYLRRRVTLLQLLLATGFLLVPTMLNETKGTLVMLPIAMLAPLFCVRSGQRPFRRLLPLLTVFAVSGVVFVSVYNSLLQYRDPGASLQEFWLEGGLQNYMYKGAVEGDHRVGRLDSLELAVLGITQSPLKAAFGLGAGNVSPSQLPGFEGDYAHYYDLYLVSFTQLSLLLWELGFVGVAAFGLFFLALFRDALLLARHDGPLETFGQAWAPLTLIAAMCLLYKPILTMNEIVFPFMLYAGIVARSAYQLRRERRTQRRERAAARKGPGRDWRAEPAMSRGHTPALR